MPDCVQCDQYFNSDAALRVHCETSPVTHLTFCIVCKHELKDAFTLQKHLNYSKAHRYDSDGYEPSESEDDQSYCTLCHRAFVDDRALHQHLQAKHDHLTHNCILCKRRFRFPSSIAQHIESGGCKKEINHHHVTAAVHAMNISPTISIPRRIEGPPLVAAVMIYSATDLAFNGIAYECYLCHREFGTLHGLNCHLRSPIHDADEFVCPNVVCGKTFKVISSLIQHIESESCGLAKFKTVEKYANRLSARFSRLLEF
ncbi:hypothetical protein VKT23_003094 [Stygiomarasmius scandens]|uniref:C2H2-type domain-containing protein n=1 Tax=Marasmiellus scandens TaxID=2682957 RepID=A0ABR1JZ79_9AGAR